MAVCALDSCRREVKPPTGSTKDPHIEKNEQGQVVRVYHNKCWMIERRRRRKGGGYTDGKYHAWAPSGYEMSEGQGRKTAQDLDPEMAVHREKAEAQYEALRVRRREQSEQQGLEERPERFDDWREPTTLTLEELEAVVAEGERRTLETGSEGGEHAEG